MTTALRVGTGWVLALPFFLLLFLFFFLLLPVAALSLGAAQAQAAAPRGRDRVGAAARMPRSPLTPEALEKVRELLGSTDPATVLTAAQALGDSQAPNAVVPLVEMLAVGARPADAVAAIDALRKLRHPSSIEVLLLYGANRNPEVRRHAVQALGGFADARVVPTLLERLGDAAPDVRTVAAEALATRGEKSAVPRMMALLKRNDAGVAAPLGALAPVSAVPAIAELQGSVDDDNLASALGAVLTRHEVPESVRVDIVKTLAKVPGAASTTALVEYVGTLPANDRRASRSEAQKAIDVRSKE